MLNSFYRWGHRGTSRESNLPKVLRLVRGRTRRLKPSQTCFGSVFSVTAVLHLCRAFYRGLLTHPFPSPDTHSRASNVEAGPIFLVPVGSHILHSSRGPGNVLCSLCPSLVVTRNTVSPVPGYGILFSYLWNRSKGTATGLCVGVCESRAQSSRVLL